MTGPVDGSPDEGAGVPQQPELSGQQPGRAGGPQRKTRQRAAVEAILERTDQFRTVAQIHDDLRHQGADIGLTTVYRHLQALADAQEVDALRTDDGEVAYRRCSTGHHHHLVCRACGRTVEVEGPAIERWTAEVAAEHGFTHVQHQLEVFGVCRDCAG